MSGKDPPPTALMLRASPNLSDDDIASLLHRDHPFGRKPVRAALDPDASSRIRFYDEKAVEDGVPYLIYSETTQRFIGYRRNGIYHLDGSETSRHMQLVFFPEARA